MKEDIEKEIIQAVKKGDIKKLQDFIDSKQKMNFEYYGGQIADKSNPYTYYNIYTNILILASEMNNEEMIKFLFSNGMDLNTYSYYYSLNCTEKQLSESALSLACKVKNFNLVKFLLENGADAQFNDNKSLKTQANNFFDTRIITLLLNYGAINNYTPRHISRYDPDEYNTGNILLDLGEKLYKLKISPPVYMDKQGHIQESNYYTDRTKEYKNLIKLFVEKGTDVNFNYDGNSPFKYAYDNNNEEIVKLFMENGGDVNALYDDEITFLYHAKSRPSKKWFLKLIRNQTPHNPKELSNILKQFSNNEKLKFSNHPWGTTQILSEELNYENFLKYLKKGWEEIESELKIYAPQLHKDIYSFLFDNISEEKYLFGKSITCGWSSDKVKNANLIGASENNKPENLEGFEKMINIFKNSFVIKQNDKNSRFLKRFMEIRKKLSRDNKFTAEIDLNGLKIEQDFKIFTDVPKLEQAIISILEEINDMGENQKVKVSFKEEELSKIEKTVLLMITHIDSTSKKSAEELEKNIEKNGGRFKDIYNNLLSVCDWSIDTICKDGVRYKIDYLYPTIDNDKPHITHILEKNEGFTYILRLYI